MFLRLALFVCGQKRKSVCASDPGVHMSACPWGRAGLLGLAACHCCHDQHHPVPACGVVVMVMTVICRGHSSLQYFRDTHRQLEEVKVREGGGELPDAQFAQRAGRWISHISHLRLSPVHITVITSNVSHLVLLTLFLYHHWVICSYKSDSSYSSFDTWCSFSFSCFGFVSQL